MATYDGFEDLLQHVARVPKTHLQLPSSTIIDDLFVGSDRNSKVLVQLQRIYSHGRLKDTGYLSILPVDQGVEHSAGASFAKNPIYFNPESIVQLALEAGCNAVASTFGVLGLVARRYAHKIPFIVKVNHNQLLSYPNQHDQIFFGTVKRAYEMGAAAIGATIYFGSQESNRQIQEIGNAFALAHELGMATVLWCYLRNGDFKKKEGDYHLSADLTGQANYLGMTLQADIIKQKLPLVNRGYQVLSFGKTDEKVYTDLSSDHPIDLCRYQVLNCFAKGVLINSGGASSSDDQREAIRTAIINKRAGGAGLIMGRKAFQRPFDEGVELIRSVQDVYLDEKITIA